MPTQPAKPELMLNAVLFSIGSDDIDATEMYANEGHAQEWQLAISLSKHSTGC